MHCHGMNKTSNVFTKNICTKQMSLLKKTFYSSLYKQLYCRTLHCWSDSSVIETLNGKRLSAMRRRELLSACAFIFLGSIFFWMALQNVQFFKFSKLHKIPEHIFTFFNFTKMAPKGSYLDAKSSGPKVVILFTQMRSGSSIVGTMSSQRTNVSYFYEPLFPFDERPCESMLNWRLEVFLGTLVIVTLTHCTIFTRQD